MEDREKEISVFICDEYSQAEIIREYFGLKNEANKQIGITYASIFKESSRDKITTALDEIMEDEYD